MLKPLIAPALAASLTLFLAACSNVTVNADYEPETDFSAFDTYAWFPQTPTSTVSEILIERIQNAVNAELDGKGMKRVEPGEASLMINQRVSVTEKLQVNDPYFAYDRFQTYEEGTLLIDLVDPKTNRLVWRGTGQTKLKELKTAEERTSRVNEVVGAVLAQYPPK